LFSAPGTPTFDNCGAAIDPYHVMRVRSDFNPSFDRHFASALRLGSGQFEHSVQSSSFSLPLFKPVQSSSFSLPLLKPVQSSSFSLPLLKP